MESKEFELLLGRVLPDGSIKEGAVGKFKMNTAGLVEFVAENAEEKGLYEDAIHLYDLAKVCVCVCVRVYAGVGTGVKVSFGRGGELCLWVGKLILWRGVRNPSVSLLLIKNWIGGKCGGGVWACTYM